MKRITLTVILAVVLAATLAVPAFAGTMVEAQCPCGYKSGTLMLFGGKANFETVCMFPVYCPGVKKVLTMNMYATPPTCPDAKESRPIPYDDPSLIGEKGKGQVAGWNTHQQLGRDLVLTTGTYLCPACNQKRMKFLHVGMWD